MALTREDGVAFLRIAPEAPVCSGETVSPLERANTALDDLRSVRLTGAAVLKVTETA